MQIPLYDRQGDRPKAVSLAEAAMGQSAALDPPEVDELQAMIGSLYMTSDPPQADKALAIYKEILNRHPGDRAALNNLACLLAEMCTPANPQEALGYVQQAYDQ